MSVLSEEIISGPLAVELAPFVAEGNDGAIVAILTRKDVPAVGVIQTADIRRYLFLNGLLLKIEEKSTEARKQTARALELFPFFTLSSALDLMAFTGLADALIADTDLGFTETHKAELLAIAGTLVSRADILGITVTIQDVAQATRGSN